MQAGINAVAKGNRSEVQEQVEQLMLSLASKEQEAREKALWAVIKIVGTITPTDQRSRARLTEMAHTLWDGLGSLQILLEEKNIYAPLVNLVREVRVSTHACAQSNATYLSSVGGMRDRRAVRERWRWWATCWRSLHSH